MLLITDVLYDGARVWICSALLGLVVIALWFVRPALRDESSGP